MYSSPMVILLTRNFPPLQGGMERLNFHICQALAKEYRVCLIGPTGAEPYCNDLVEVHTHPPLPVWRFLFGAFWQTLLLSKRLRAKLIVAGSGVAALPAVLAGSLTGVPVLTYLHGLDIIAPHPIYQRVFLPTIRRCDAWLANSQHTRTLAIRAGIPGDKVEILHPGTSLPHGATSDAGKRFRDRIQAGTRPLLLSVGRLTRRKGLLEFVENALTVVVKRQPDVLLVIIGTEATQSVAGASGAIEQTLHSRIDALGLGRNVIFLGNVDDEMLSEAYAASQLHVFPGIEVPGDVEGFGMVALEAAAHGLPTVAFAVGGISDAVCHEVSGWLIQPGDYPAMAEAIHLNLINSRHSGVTQETCRRFAAAFEWPIFESKLIAALDKHVHRAHV